MITLVADGLLSEPEPPPLVVAPAPAFTEMRLLGELDVETAPVLAALIERQIATGQLEVRLDLGELGFCDVCGCRALLRARRRLAAAGGQLVLLRPAPMLVRVATLCGWSDELGMRADVGRRLSAVPDGRPSVAGQPPRPVTTTGEAPAPATR